jgi:sugar lactone lactonase YvrE
VDGAGGLGEGLTSFPWPHTLPPLLLQPRSTVPKKLLTIALLVAASAAVHAADAYKWSVQYLIDNSQSVEGREQKVWPRRTRGLALSPDGKFLYAGYLHSWGKRGEVRKIAVDVADFETAVDAVLPGPAGAALATDDRGRVYISDANGILVYDSDLQARQYRIPIADCRGIAVVRDGANLVLYAADHPNATVQRWVLTEAGDRIRDAKLNGFDGSGLFKVPGAKGLRGLEVDPKGNIWVCDHEANLVFKVRKDGKDIKSVEVKSAADLAFDGSRVLVTRGEERAITVLDDALVVVGNLSVPWEELEISPFGNNQEGALAGIVSVPGRGFYVANEGGQTGEQRSTYGRADDNAELIGGKLFRDAKDDDNDPILKATAVVTTAAK